MKNLDQRNQIIEHSLKLNSTNLSPLRSGNISLRAEQDNIQGYLITPSGKKYETLKPEDKPASLVDVGGPESITPINSKKELDVASNLELSEGTPTIVNIPLDNQGMNSGGTGGASSEKGDAQTIPNIPSSDFANTSVAMAESVFNLAGVDR